MSSSKNAVYGIGAALVDHTFHVPDDILSQLGCEKGSMRKVSPAERAKIFWALGGVVSDRQPAGSISITLQAVAALGGEATFNCVLGSDELATAYRAEMEARGVSLEAMQANGETGVSIILVTPDSERTMRTDPGVGNEFTASMRPLSGFSWCCMSAHLLLGGARGAAAIRSGIAAARQGQAKVAFSLGSAFAMQTHAAEVLAVAAQSDLVIGNASEWSALEAAVGPRGCKTSLSSRCPLLVTTMGGAGAEVIYSGGLTTISPAPCTALNATGAGDVFLGTLLFNLASGIPVVPSAERAAQLASQSVSIGFHAFRSLMSSKKRN